MISLNTISVLRKILAALIIGVVPVSAESPEQLFFEGNILFGESRHEEALERYQKALAEHPGAALHFNTGMALYQLGRFAEARLHWERALSINPRYQPAIESLGILIRENGLAAEPSGVWRLITHSLPLRSWINLSMAVFWFSLFAFLLARLRRDSRIRAFGSALLLLFIFGMAVVWIRYPESRMAIVTSDEAVLRVAPTPGSPTLAAVSAAEKVRLLEPFGEFYRVRLPDQTEGFLNSRHVAAIKVRN